MSDSRQMEMADACGTVFHGQNNKKKKWTSAIFQKHIDYGRVFSHSQTSTYY
jgi:hypothetical protein